jgi:hypothetical protein
MRKTSAAPRLIYNIGINDADYVVRKLETVGYTDGKQTQRVVWYCPYYSIWKSMLGRVHDKKGLAYKYYKDCTIAPEWLRFSVFKRWMEGQDWSEKCLDKDILLEGNRVYGPATCVFVSQHVNKFVLLNTKNTNLPAGVTCVNWGGGDRFVARYKWEGLSRNIGTFSSPALAHAAWRAMKLSLVPKLGITDARVIQALNNRYRQEEK